MPELKCPGGHALRRSEPQGGPSGRSSQSYKGRSYKLLCIGFYRCSAEAAGGRDGHPALPGQPPTEPDEDQAGCAPEHAAHAGRRREPRSSHRRVVSHGGNAAMIERFDLWFPPHRAHIPRSTWRPYFRACSNRGSWTLCSASPCDPTWRSARNSPGPAINSSRHPGPDRMSREYRFVREQ